MGYIDVAVLMSFHCIEVSSEDEVEFIEVPRTPSDNPSILSQRNAICKLSRNSNIELTINLETFSDEIYEQKEASRHPKVSNKNGLISSHSICKNELDEKEKEKERCAPKKEPRSGSPEVVIIEDDILTINSLSSVVNQHSSNNLKPPRDPSGSQTIKGTHNEVKSLHLDNRLQNNETSIKKECTSDIVYISDDGSDEDSANTQLLKTDKYNPTPSGSRSSTNAKKIINVLREKIKSNLESGQNNNSCIASKGKRGLNPDIEHEESSKKKRICPERIAKETICHSAHKARFTRSSVSVSVSDVESTSQPRIVDKKCPVDIRTGPMDKFSIKNLFSELVDLCNTIFTDEGLASKLWKTYSNASDKVLRSEEFISALKAALSSSKKSDTLDEKLTIVRNIKEVIRIMKRHPVVVDKKVTKLKNMLNILRGRIKKLEEAEVTSDEDGDNAYLLLDRYRARAAKIYEKLCELQGEPAHAGRLVRQKFTFTGNSGYPKIEQALQKFYFKTKSFPDFMDVKSLVEMTVKKENMDIPPMKIQNIAQSLFIEFGNRLQRMRCYDEYSIMIEYLEDGKAKDPALDNEELKKELSKLDSAKKIHEAEQKIFEEFSCKQVEQKTKEDSKSEESEVNDVSEDENAAINKVRNLGGLHISDTDEELINSEVKVERACKK